MNLPPLIFNTFGKKFATKRRDWKTLPNILDTKVEERRLKRDSFIARYVLFTNALSVVQRSILRNMPAAPSDSPPTLYVAHGRAKPVFHGPNSTEPSLFHRGETTVQGWMTVWECGRYALEKGCLPHIRKYNRAPVLFQTSRDQPREWYAHRLRHHARRDHVRHHPRRYVRSLARTWYKCVTSLQRAVR